MMVGETDQRWRPVKSGPAPNDRQLMKLESEWQLALSTFPGDAAINSNQKPTEVAWRIRDIELEVIATPAKSLMGLAVKIRFLDRALTLGPTREDEDMSKSTLADLDQMIRKWS